MKSRIFTFGCSFTEYVWPTWADIILYKNIGYNLGVIGGGFDMILYRLLEADRKFKFTKNDNIIIIFTTPLRWDILRGDTELTWECKGQVTTSEYKEYENKFYTLDGLLYKSFYNIFLIVDFLNKRNLNFLIGSINNVFENYDNHFEYSKLNTEILDLIDYVKNIAELKLLDFHSFLYNSQSKFNKSWKVTKKWADGMLDYHPRPEEHLEWVNKVLLKHLNIDVKINEEDIASIENDIDGLKLLKDSSESLSKKYPLYYEHRKGSIAYL